MSSLTSWWDSICNECGQCCCEKYPARLVKKKQRRIPGSLSANGRFFIDFTSPCSFLDIENGKCMVFESRFTTCKTCVPMTFLHALFADYLPRSCGYVRKFRFWVKQ